MKEEPAWQMASELKGKGVVQYDSEEAVTMDDLQQFQDLGKAALPNSVEARICYIIQPWKTPKGQSQNIGP